MIRTIKGSQFTMSSVTRKDFKADPHGRRYSDVVNDGSGMFGRVIDFFDDECRHQRLIDAELHQDRPALAGVLIELEYEAWFDTHMRATDAHQTKRLRQAIGVLTRMIMARYGFKTKGEKGNLGRRAKVAAGTALPGAYHNVSGISLWFGSAERYELEDGGNPFESVSKRAKQFP